MESFWKWDKSKSWPPESITELEDYTQTKRLSLFITQLPLKPHIQKKLVEAWCERLGKLEEVKYLWFTSRVNQKMFDAACNMPNLEGLWIKWSGIRRIDEIVKLNKLKHLHLGSSSKVESIDVLKQMNNLETLELEQLNLISDFSILSNLTQLRRLGIDGSIWTAQKIESLKPISKLVNLQYLSTTNSKIQDKSFEPLLGLENLIRFNCSWNYPLEEFEKLKKMKNLKYGNVETSLKEIQTEVTKYYLENFQ
ncbi:MAG: hypothetical protein SCALA702_01220 [Melioribacteraceae bacterium]|nr:MAG: hypothetical protein SCALA702_01220 [Melioribacteraceae bacterium]